MLLLYRGQEFDANFYYHAGMDVDNSFLLKEGGRKTLLVSRLNESFARAHFRGRVIVYDDAIKELSRLLGRRRVLFDAISMNARLAARLSRVCRLKDYSQELLLQRAQKRPDEVACVRKAVKHTKEIFHSLDLKAAKTELDVQKQLLVATFEQGLEPAFEPIVASDRNSAYPHSTPGNKKLGSVVLVDYGVRCNHYCADLSRCFISDRKKKGQYERLQDICFFLADSLPGLERGRDVAKLAQDLMKKAGFPRMIHSIGHGVGLDIHEFPRLGPKSDDKLGRSTLAIEPAFYLERYGMRYEETVWFDGKRARIL